MPTNPRNRVAISATISLLLLAACSLQREQVVKQLDSIEVQPRWSQAAVDSGAGWDAGLYDWQLQAAADALLASNQQLQAATRNWQAAAYAAQASGADVLPQLEAGISASRGLSNSIYSNSFAAELSLNWDLDLWDSLDNSAKIALLSADDARINLRELEHTLLYQLMADWLEMLQLGSNLRLLNARVDNYRQQISIIEARIEQGLSSLLDLYSAQATLASSEANLVSSEYQLAATKRNISWLSGFTEFSATPATLPELSSLSADLQQQDLRANRNDLLLAQNALAAQDLRLANAINARLPSLSLSSSLGRSASDSADLLLSDANVANIIVNLGAPIFDYGKRQQLAEQARALAYENLHNYRYLLTAAIHEVDELLQLDANLAQRLAARQRALTNWRALGDIYSEQYLLGLQDYQNLLDNEQRIFDAELSVLDLQYQAWLNRLNLAQALGLLAK